MNSMYPDPYTFVNSSPISYTYLPPTFLVISFHITFHILFEIFSAVSILLILSG